MTLTLLMHETLVRAIAEDGLRRVRRPDLPGADDWPAPSASLRALVGHGFLIRSVGISRQGNHMEVWKITDAGRAALIPPARIPTGYRRERDGQVIDRGQAMLGPRDPGAWDGPVLIRKPAPEPEKVPHSVVERLPATMHAQQRWAAVQLERQRDREDMTLTERIERAIQSARAAGVDPAVYEQAILRRVRALESRIRKAA